MVGVKATINIHAFQLNEEENARVAKRRADRLLREAEERRWGFFVVLSLLREPDEIRWSSLSTLQK